MNRFEFKEVLKEEGIRESYTFTSGRYNEHEDVYYWNNLIIYFSGSYYCIAKGNIPKEVARKLYELDILGNNINYVFDTKKKNRDEVNLDSLKILTPKGLFLLIEVYKQYLSNKIDEELDIDSKYLDYKENILKLGKVNISNIDWINKIDKDAYIYNTTIETTENGILQYLRNAINEFDEAINPFLNKDLSKVSNNMNLLDMNYSVNYYPHNCDLTIMSDDKTKELHYIREKDGFHYIINSAKDNCLYTCTHYFTKTIEGDCTGEIIKISKQSKTPYIFTYNITKGTFEFSDGRVVPASIEVAALIIDELNKYTEEAKEVYNNALINNKERKLV